MESLNLTTAELVRIIVVAVVLLGGLALLRWALKLTARILALGCLGILAVLAVLVVMGMMA